MALVPYTITVIERDVADAEASGKQVVVGAVCSMFLQPTDTAALLYDDSEGNGGSTAKTTNSNGQVTVYVDAGDYRVSVNGNSSFISLKAGGTGVVETVTETQALAAAQTVVTLVDVTTTSTAFYINGPSVDNGRLVLGVDYTVNTTAQITLATSYADGTLITAVQNDTTEGVKPDIQVFDNVFDMQQSTIEVGKIAKTKGYYTPNDGGGAEYLIVASATVDGYTDHALDNSNFAILFANGFVSAKQCGLKGDRVTDDSVAEAALSVSRHLSIYFPEGIYRTNVNNGTSNRTYMFAEDAIIDGVIHITGTGPASAPPQPTITWVDNVRIIGTATTTVRFGTFYCKNVNVDKVRITEVSASYLNQTAVGGSTGVHLYFGTKDMHIGEIICDSGSLFYNLSIDQGPIKGVDEIPEDIHIGRLLINQTNVAGLVTAETKNLKIDEIIQKNQAVANVGWTSVNDIDMKIGSYEHNGLGAGSGQFGAYFNNTDPLSSVEFGSVDMRNCPAIAFRTFNTGTVHINKFKGVNNREHMRAQSRVTIDFFEGYESLEVGLNFFDNFAGDSYVGRAYITGTVGTGVNAGSDNVTIGSLKCEGFALYGLQIPLNTGNFNNSYYEGVGCGQGLRILSTQDVNMGVLNLRDNTNGIIGSGVGKFGYDYAYFDNNGTNSNFTLELSNGFRGKKVRQSVSTDRGDVDVSIAVGTDASTQRFATELTAIRTVTFTTTGAVNGDKFRISRTGAGTFNLSTSGTFNNKALAINEWADYEYQGAGWHLTGFGAL